jgi:transcriptional regulator with XRE-family HTH domain
MNTPHEGHRLLRVWREGPPKRSQKFVAEKLGIEQPTVCSWERDRRPELPAAIELELLTGGVVPVEAWGYSADVVAQMGQLVAGRYFNRAAGG